MYNEFAPTADILFLLVLSILTLESVHSIRFLYPHFLSGITTKSLNTFYHACSYAKVDYSHFMNITAKVALRMIPDSLATQPIFLCVDDTMVAKAGTRFENVSKLFDHAAHNGSNYLNGHCFVSIMLCIPVWKNNRVSYLSLPLGYRMWQLVHKAKSGFNRWWIPESGSYRQCQDWFYHVWSCSCTYRRRGRPAKHGKRLSVETDFAFSNEKIGDYYIGAHRVITNLLGCREIQAYVTATEKEPLNQTGSDRMKYIPLFLYSFRWNIETSYYEQKTFWSLCSYMVRSCKGIEMLVNLINICYCAMKILPYQDEQFS